MDTIEAVRDVNPEAVKCVICGAEATTYMSSKNVLPICANTVCSESIVVGINKLLVALKNEEVPA